MCIGQPSASFTNKTYDMSLETLEHSMMEIAISCCLYTTLVIRALFIRYIVLFLAIMGEEILIDSSSRSLPNLFETPAIQNITAGMMLQRPDLVDCFILAKLDCLYFIYFSHAYTAFPPRKLGMIYILPSFFLHNNTYLRDQLATGSRSSRKFHGWAGVWNPDLSSPKPEPIQWPNSLQKQLVMDAAI